MILGRVAGDLAVMLAGGGEVIADLAVLRNRSDLFGPVASDVTAWRVLDGIDAAALDRTLNEITIVQDMPTLGLAYNNL